MMNKILWGGGAVFKNSSAPFPMNPAYFNNIKENIWMTAHAYIHKEYQKFCNFKICNDYKRAFLTYAKFELHKAFQNKK